MTEHTLSSVEGRGLEFDGRGVVSTLSRGCGSYEVGGWYSGSSCAVVGVVANTILIVSLSFHYIKYHMVSSKKCLNLV